MKYCVVNARCLLRLPESDGNVAEIIAGVAQMRIGVARHEAEIELPRELVAELGRKSQVVVIVVVAPFARQQQIERSDRGRAGMEVLDIGAVVQLVRGAAQARALIERIE